MRRNGSWRMAVSEKTILLSNCSIVDGQTDERREDMHVLVRGNLIEEVSDRPIAAAGAIQVDLKGETLMPGLVDCHVHVVASEVNLDKNAGLPNSLIALK